MKPAMSTEAAFLAQKKAKYASARVSILLIVILSVVNLFSIVFADTYFLFSSYFTQILGALGAAFYQETGAMALLIIFVALGIISVVPYLLCWIFSGKKMGWMIAAEVLFALDSVLFLVDFVAMLASGEMGMIFDLVIRIYALGSIAFGIKHGLDIKKMPLPTTAAEEVPAAGFSVAAEGEEAAPAEDGVTRTLTVQRAKSFVGAIVAYECHVDGTLVGSIKNGQSLDVTVSGAAHELVICSPDRSAVGSLQIGAGDENKVCKFSIKMGATGFKIVLEEVI